MTHDRCEDCGAPLDANGRHGDELPQDVREAIAMLDVIALQRRRRQLDPPHDSRAALAAARAYARQLPPGDGLTPAMLYAFLSYRTGVERATLTEALDEAHVLVSLLATFPQAMSAIRQQSIADELTAALRDDERRS